MDLASSSSACGRARLSYHEVMQIDATHRQPLVEPEPFGMVLMAGRKSAEFNSFLWKQIIEKALRLSRTTLITVETEMEAHAIVPWCVGRKVRSSRQRNPSMTDGWSSLSEGTSL